MGKGEGIAPHETGHEKVVGQQLHQDQRVESVITLQTKPDGGLRVGRDSGGRHHTQKCIPKAMSITNRQQLFLSCRVKLCA